jgi:hypothetical protein
MKRFGDISTLRRNSKELSKNKVYKIFLRIFSEMQGSADEAYPVCTLGGADTAVPEKDKENVNVIL